MDPPKDEQIVQAQSLYGVCGPYLTKLAHGTAPFISTFLLIHLSAPVMANVGGTSLASQIMLLGREYYQTSFGEKYLLLAPLAIHTLSGLAKRLISPPHLRRRFTSVLGITGYSVFLFFLPIHFLNHRVYPADPSPPIYEVGPSELDYEFVKVSLQTWPWRSWFLYGGLALCVAWHAAEGLKIIWNTSLRDIYGAWRSSTRRRIIGVTLAVVPVLTGVYVMSQEPIYAFSSLAARFRHALYHSFMYRI
ncbi:hypothetical protein EIP91_011653 [Steccherinum ochraceum]|uniref:Mitochondrial adapter protein MCP1 transmembrane domain-containing protein n=1 Tax=Steccherinum ochraceum TaxID=92696 RepID=A0A4R0RY45_9APHY|nr:hypothetical protein EIP91_011653 [Steccherinum ochraceum]